jgi:hypothetical protein
MMWHIYTQGTFTHKEKGWYLAYLYSECYAFPNSLVYAVKYTGKGRAAENVMFVYSNVIVVDNNNNNNITLYTINTR